MKKIFLSSAHRAQHFGAKLIVTLRPNLLTIFFVTLVLTGCASSKVSLTKEQATLDFDLLLTLPDEPISYQNSVKPVLERRCVVCHGCFDASCQLKLSSIEGIKRGASKQLVYDGFRISGAEPTRLMIDAKSTAEWRDKDFHPILNESETTTPAQNLDQSVLYQMLRLKQLNPQARVGMLSDDFDLALDREQVCPTRDEFPKYAKKHPGWGMPYAMPNLNDKEYKTLVQWIAQGSPALPEPAATKHMAKEIARWEQFFNGSSNKEKLVSRYIYEHLFLGHIHFTGTPPRQFYRLVRSTTPPGQAIDEIATRRPYDDPGVAPFYYRLRPYHASIVAKDHIVYELSPQKRVRYRQLFLESDYEVKNLPSYNPDIASNPFKVYEAIPPQVRYRFLLDDARFFIEGFIKGPVCRGQIALNVIEDHFWVFFLDPDWYDTTDDADFLKTHSDNLNMPTERGDTLKIFAARAEYKDKIQGYWKAKQDAFLAQSEQDHSDVAEVIKTAIWDGGGTDPNAALTIFRHFDSASVNFGLTGNYPETAWVIDYPLLERIHYLLVAGFDVYGNVGHQLNTRLYMDFLRMEGEDHFLAFLPANKRREIRDSWYKGMRADLDGNVGKWLDKEIMVGYKTDDPQTELYRHLERRLGAMAGPKDFLNRCQSQPCQFPATDSAEQQADTALAKVAEIKGPILQVFPDVAFVRVRNGNQKQNFAYTMIRNKAYSNLSSMFASGGDDQHDVENDTMTVVKGLRGTYPNFFFDIELKQVNAFAERYAAISNRKDYEQFVGLFGVRRTRSDFWTISDWFQDYYAEQEPVLSGLFDLSRYDNR